MFCVCECSAEIFPKHNMFGTKWIIFWVVWPIFLEPPLFVLRKWRLEGGFIHGSPKQPADRAQELWPIFARNTLTGAHRFLAAEVKGCGMLWVILGAGFWEKLRANLVIFGEWLLYALIANNSLYNAVTYMAISPQRCFFSATARSGTCLTGWP